MHDLNATAIAALVRSRKLSATQVMRHFLDRTARIEPQLNAYAVLDADGAMQQALALDGRIAAGQDPGALAGVPVSVKDLIAVGGLPQAFGSRVFRDNQAAEDAPSVARLRAAGACITGKTTTSELGSKAVGDCPLTGVTRNPWNTAHTPGGSSAGAAAGVAAGLVPVALGTDGGGSIRIPAAFCGLVGIKGSYGRVPVWPASATPGLAHVAPLARSVGDAIALFDVIAGPDPRDASSQQFPAWVPGAGAAPPPSGLRIGWCEDFRYGWASSDARTAAHDAAAALAGELQVPLGQWIGLQHDPMDAWAGEFYSGIARRLKLHERALPDVEGLLDAPLAREVARMRSVGPDAFAAHARMAAACRAEIEHAFTKFDLLLMPTMPTAALPVGQDAPAGHEASGAVAWSYFTYPFNLSGHPAASYPAGLTADGLPLGLQLVARRGQEHLLFAALRALERVRPPPACPAR